MNTFQFGYRAGQSSPLRSLFLWAIGLSMVCMASLAHAASQSLHQVIEAEAPGVGHNVGFATPDGWAARADVLNTYLMWNAVFNAPFEGRGKATFYLRIDINNTNLADRIVNLDIYDRTASKIIASKLLTRGQFMNAGLNSKFLPIPVYFNTYDNGGGTHQLEARVWTYAKAYSEVDKVKFDLAPYAFHGPSTAQDGLVDNANTLRGADSGDNNSYSHGETFPAVAVPFGFNFWSPVTRNDMLRWFYEFYDNGDHQKPLNRIFAFAAVHEPSPWIGNRQSMQIMPMLLPDSPPPQGTLYETDRDRRGLKFDHRNEVARPHYYSVNFDNGLRTEIAPTNRAAYFRFTIPEGQSEAALMFDKSSGNGNVQTDGVEQSLFGWAKDDGTEMHNAPILYFYAKFDTPFFAANKLDDVATVLRFKGSAYDRAQINVRIATSFISAAQAKANLEAEIPSGQSFETTKANAAAAWNDKLGMIAIPGASDEQKIKLYSNMYRAFLYPNMAWENVNGRPAYISPYVGKLDYSNPGFVNPNPTRTGKLWANNGFWDTYRTAWPLYSLLQPQQTGEMLDGFIRGYKDGGWVTRWSDPGYIDCMVATSSDVIFADAYMKGVRNFDTNAAFASMLRNAATESTDIRLGRKDNKHMNFYGYKPSDGQVVVDKDQTASYLAWSLESYINDAGIAQMAKALGYNDEYVYYNNRALNYTKLFSNEKSGIWAGSWLRGKDMAGNWVDNQQYLDSWTGGLKSQRSYPATPNSWGFGYTEGNAWHYALTVPQDGTGLANLYGGRQALANKLDAMFSTRAAPIDLGSYGAMTPEQRAAMEVDAVARTGQYNHSNQPSHGYIFMYNYAGQPYKTQYWVREVMNRLYGTGLNAKGYPDGSGYFGDDDNGEQSAWYVFNVLGFYPLAVGRPEYVISAPQTARAEVTLENGKKIVVLAPGISDVNRYVRSVKLNGVAIDRSYLLHSEIANGAVIEFAMGSFPSRWATSESGVPPSLTQGNQLPQPDQSLMHSGDYALSTNSNSALEGALTDRSSANGHIWNSGAYAYVTATASVGSNGPTVTHYTLTSGLGDPSRDPHSWTLYGSNNGVNDWRVIERRRDVSFKWREYTRPFALKNPTTYKYLRLAFDNPGDIDIGEVEFYGKPATQRPTALVAGVALTPGQFMASPNGQYRLILQGDGNLVLYRTADHAALWASNTNGKSAARFIFQGDGNAVIYDNQGTPIFATGTNGKGGVRLNVQDDGNLVMYSAQNQVA